MPTAQEVYTATVRTLSIAERLRLAALILNDLADTDVAVIDSGESWSEQDHRDLTAYSLRYAAALYPEDEDLV